MASTYPLPIDDKIDDKIKAIKKKYEISKKTIILRSIEFATENVEQVFGEKK